jgi:hypothetical protein
MKYQPAESFHGIYLSWIARNRMKAGVIVALTCLLWSQAWAADSVRLGENEPSDHLIPIPPDCDPYRVLLCDKLDLNKGKYINYGRMVYRPAFKGEFAVTVCGDYGPEIPAKVYAFHIRTVRANQNIWYSMSGHGELKLQNLKISTTDVPIDDDFAKAIQRAWVAMLLKTRYSLKGSNDLRDGYIAEFSVENETCGILYGETRSPKTGQTKRFVDLGMELADFCDLKPEQRAQREKELLKKLIGT